MKFIRHGHNSLDALLQSEPDKIRIARTLDGAFEIIIARRRGILDFAAANPNTALAGFWVRLLLVYFIGIESIFQRDQPDDGLENRTGRIVFVGRTVDERPELGIV